MRPTTFRSPARSGMIAHALSTCTSWFASAYPGAVLPLARYALPRAGRRQWSSQRLGPASRDPTSGRRSCRDVCSCGQACRSTGPAVGRLPSGREQRFSYEAWIPASGNIESSCTGNSSSDASSGDRRHGRSGQALRGLARKPLAAWVVLRQWNQSLAQQAVLPEFLPTLGVRQIRWSERRRDCCADPRHRGARCGGRCGVARRVLSDVSAIHLQALCLDFDG